MSKYKVLFVCMGNICRSPAAEGVMLHLANARDLASHLHVDSAGTIGFHAGEMADARMRTAAKARGVKLTSRARQVHSGDLNEFDMVVTMDRDNYNDVVRLTDDPDLRAKVRPFSDFCKKHTAPDVPDPYYGGNAGFENVLDMLEEGCGNLAQEITEILKTRV